MVIAYDKKTGEAVWFSYPVDAREAVNYGYYVYDKPDDAKAQSEEGIDFDSVKDTAEKQRLGGQVTEADAENLKKFQALEQKESPAALPPAAPEADEVVDTFNPATADRAELFDWLVKNDEPAQNALSTANLRARVFDKIGVKQASSE